jgi:hypothetical protein
MILYLMRHGESETTQAEVQEHRLEQAYLYIRGRIIENPSMTCPPKQILILKLKKYNS